MTTPGRRRGHGAGSIYFNAVNKCWTAAVSLGFSPDGKRIRRKATGKTKTEVRDKLKAIRKELEARILSSPTYTMALCVEDWLSQGLGELSPSTISNYRHAAEHAAAALGRVKLRELSARHVQKALDDLSGHCPRGICGWSIRSSSGPSGTRRQLTWWHGAWRRWSGCR